MDVNKVLVPVKGDKADTEAVRQACNMVRKKKGRVYVLYVIEMERALPLDAEVQADTMRGEEILEQVERIAKEEKCQVETEILQAREVGPTVVEEAVERGAEFIIMGMSYKKRFGEFSLGSVVPYVLKNAPCYVWVLRDSMN